MGDAEAHCRELMQRLHPFVDNELEEAVCAELQRHLDECTHCDDVVTFERAFRVVIRTKCQEKDVPAGLEDRLRTELRKRAEGANE